MRIFYWHLWHDVVDGGMWVPLNIYTLNKDFGGVLYYYNDNRHRLNGPALIRGHEKLWFINNIDITKEVELWIKENNYPEWIDENSWDDAIRLHFKMTFSNG